MAEADRRSAQSDQDDVGSENYRRVMAGLAEARAIMDGTAKPGSFTIHHVEVPDVEVKAIRARTGLSQVKFAARYGFSPGAVRDWEQGRKRPERASRLLLTLIDTRRDVVEDLVDRL